MSKLMPLSLMSLITLAAGTSLVPAQKTPSPGQGQVQQPIRYEAEEGVPKDKAGEKRRDYAVLEATLNDLASPRNPEHKYHIQNVGPGREIVIDDNTCDYDMFIDIGGDIHDIDNKDPRSIPADMQDDFRRRNLERARSLADFKPANSNIIVRDLDRLFEEADAPLDAFLKKYPTAWGFVWAYQPGYSKNGTHGLNWVYMLTKKGKRWEVEWRHCRPRE
jgi:hypothetical protein